MKKKFLYVALFALTLASCSDIFCSMILFLLYLVSFYYKRYRDK